MNTKPAQPIPRDSQRPDQHSPCPCHDTLDCPDQAMTAINANQLADIAELLDILDGFLRHPDDTADPLTDYLHTTGRDHPQPPHGACYTADLRIDQVSFTAHALRVHRRQPLQ
jgi:hypothetical protein